MASAKLYTNDGAEKATAELNDAIFAVALNRTLVHEVVLAYRNAKRQGNHETKVRKHVSGGGAKPFKQKGTGNARQGSSREPHMRGGGVVFGPHKRSHRQKVTLRARRTALRCVLSHRLRDDMLVVCEGFPGDLPKTKPVLDLVTKVGANARKVLLVTSELNPNLVQSAANLPQVTVRTALDVNALDVLGAQRVVLESEAISKLEERLS